MNNKNDRKYITVRAITYFRVSLVKNDKR